MIKIKTFSHWEAKVQNLQESCIQLRKKKQRKINETERANKNNAIGSNS